MNPNRTILQCHALKMINSQENSSFFLSEDINLFVVHTDGPIGIPFRSAAN